MCECDTFNAVVRSLVIWDHTVLIYCRVTCHLIKVILTRWHMAYLSML